jgi:hypothetical protein
MSDIRPVREPTERRVPRIVVIRGRVADSTPPQGSRWPPDFPDGLPDGEYVPVAEVERLREALTREQTISAGLRASLAKMREDGDRALRGRS